MKRDREAYSEQSVIGSDFSDICGRFHFFKFKICCDNHWLSGADSVFNDGLILKNLKKVK